jgi:hypothetical protein
MAGTNPNYLPQAGDVFTAPIGDVVVDRGYGVSHFFAPFNTVGKGVLETSWNHRTPNVGVKRTPNVEAVADLAAAEGNTGSGVLTGVGVNSPLVNAAIPATGGPAGLCGPGPWTIAFTETRVDEVETTTYQVTNAADTVIESGAYTNPTTITFLGVSVQIAGAPANGDAFTVTGNAYTGAF